MIGATLDDAETRRVPNTCATQGSQRCLRWSRHCGGGSVKPSADPMLVRNRHLPLLLARGKPPRSRPTPSAATQRAQKPWPTIVDFGMWFHPAEGMQHSEAPQSDAPEQPVLDVRNRPDSHRPRRTERRVRVRVARAARSRTVTSTGPEAPTRWNPSLQPEGQVCVLTPEPLSRPR